MASLKEVKSRMGSVESTQKIAQARQMVSSAELHRAQREFETAQHYCDRVFSLLGSLVASGTEPDSPLTAPNESGDTALIVMSSNAGMAGSFNTRIIKETSAPEALFPGERVRLFPLGRKIREAFKRSEREFEGDYDHLMAHPSEEEVSAFLTDLTERYAAGEFRRVEIVSYHFRTMGTQNIVRRTLLPFALPEPADNETGIADDMYILEPSADAIVQSLLPLAMSAFFHRILLDQAVSEHACRMLAMQTASDNADDLLEELRLTYNKVRQQSITTELLDLVGSSFA